MRRERWMWDTLSLRVNGSSSLVVIYCERYAGRCESVEKCAVFQNPIPLLTSYPLFPPRYYFWIAYFDLNICINQWLTNADYYWPTDKFALYTSFVNRAEIYQLTFGFRIKGKGLLIRDQRGFASPQISVLSPFILKPLPIIVIPACPILHFI